MPRSHAWSTTSWLRSTGCSSPSCSAGLPTRRPWSSSQERTTSHVHRRRSHARGDLDRRTRVIPVGLGPCPKAARTLGQTRQRVEPSRALARARSPIESGAWRPWRLGGSSGIDASYAAEPNPSPRCRLARRRGAVFGMKSIAAIAIGAGAIAAAAWRGALDPAHLASLSGTAAFLVGLVAALAVGLIASGWHPEVRSRTAIAFRGGRPSVIDEISLPAKLLAGR